MQRRVGGSARVHSTGVVCPQLIGKRRCMDSMEINKGVAAVLVAGIVFFLTA
jgi:hypothetical protein